MDKRKIHIVQKCTSKLFSTIITRGIENVFELIQCKLSHMCVLYIEEVLTGVSYGNNNIIKLIYEVQNEIP